MTDGDDTAQSRIYDQTFFRDLAAKGKDEWNKWRRDPANENVPVNFAGVDFSEPSRDRIDFSGFAATTLLPSPQPLCRAARIPETKTIGKPERLT